MACLIPDPATWLKVDNQTDQKLVIFIDGYSQGYIQPGRITEIVTRAIDPLNIYPDRKYLIEAKTEDGEVVYSEKFTWQELDDMDWTTVIPPPATS